MAGVAVTVTNENTNTLNPLASDVSGAYTAVSLIPGSCAATATKSGFKTANFRNFVLQVGQTARLDIALEVGSVEQSVEVAGG